MERGRHLNFSGFRADRFRKFLCFLGGTHESGLDDPRQNEVTLATPLALVKPARL
jgi:hypothetical protein